MDRLKNPLIKQVFKTHATIMAIDNPRFLIYDILLNDIYLKVMKLGWNIQNMKIKFVESLNLKRLYSCCFRLRPW